MFFFLKKKILFKVVLGKSVAEVAQNVIKHVRLALLTPEELKQVELDNEKDRMIPVSPPGEGTRQIFIRRGSAPGCKPLPFHMPLLTEKITISCTFNGKW